VYRSFIEAQGVLIKSLKHPEASPEASEKTTPGFWQHQVACMAGLLVECSWNPGASIECFLNILKEHGPVVVTGFLGDKCHTEPATQQPMPIEGLNTWAWKKGTAKDCREIGSEGHAVIVIGASKKAYGATSQNYVYWRDPTLEDDNIFRMSYELFCTRVVSTEGFKTLVFDPRDTTHYLYYHPETPLREVRVAASAAIAPSVSAVTPTVDTHHAVPTTCNYNLLNAALVFAVVGATTAVAWTLTRE
jgi:hypothetical protein